MKILFTASAVSVGRGTRSFQTTTDLVTVRWVGEVQWPAVAAGTPWRHCADLPAETVAQVEVCGPGSIRLLTNVSVDAWVSAEVSPDIVPHLIGTHGFERCTDPTRLDTFLDAVLAGKLVPGDIEGWLTRWNLAPVPSHHLGATATPFESLGMTREEYQEWMMDPGTLDSIVASRRAGDH